MSKKDSLKEKIAFLRIWLVSCIAVVISLSSWVIKNISLSFLCYIAIFILFVLIFIIYKICFKIFEYIKELEKL